VAPVSAWQASGAIALRFAAAALEPKGAVTGDMYWRDPMTVAADQTLDGGPVKLTFIGQAIAIIGVLGDKCCESGHAKVFVDGVETTDRTGIWQNKSPARVRLPGTVLFAWRWPVSGAHTILVTAGDQNPKEGGPYFHMTEYKVVP
jgi:hypothetical protein